MPLTERADSAARPAPGMVPRPAAPLPLPWYHPDLALLGPDADGHHLLGQLLLLQPDGLLRRSVQSSAQWARRGAVRGGGRRAVGMSRGQPKALHASRSLGCWHFTPACGYPSLRARTSMAISQKGFMLILTFVRSTPLCGGATGGGVVGSHDEEGLHRSCPAGTHRAGYSAALAHCSPALLSGFKQSEDDHRCKSFCG